MKEENKKRGWIKLYRSIQDNPIWKDKPFSQGQAGIDLLLMANREDRNVMIGNQVMNVKSGSFITSIVRLSERWGWERTKTSRFLKCLESDSQIALQTHNKCTAITIANWAFYQNQCTSDAQQTHNKCTSDAHQTHTNKNKEQRTKNSFIPKNKFNQFSQRDQSEKDYVDLERRKLNGG